MEREYGFSPYFNIRGKPVYRKDFRRSWDPGKLLPRSKPPIWESASDYNEIRKQSIATFGKAKENLRDFAKWYRHEGQVSAPALTSTLVGTLIYVPFAHRDIRHLVAMHPKGFLLVVKRPTYRESLRLLNICSVTRNTLLTREKRNRLARIKHYCASANWSNIVMTYL